MKAIYWLRKFFSKRNPVKPTPEHKKRHVEKALDMMGRPELAKFITIDYPVNKKGICPRVIFTIQSNNVSEVGVNGCQVEDMIEYTRNLVKCLNSSFPCDENRQTLQHLDGALQWQINRTNDRKHRKVEGKNKK